MASRLTLLLQTLDELTLKDLNKFRLYLSNGALDGFKPILGGKLPEDSDVSVIAGQMKAKYGLQDSMKVTLHILKEIQQDELARRFEKALDKIEGSQSSQLDVSQSDKRNEYDAATAAGSRQVNSESRTKYMIGDKHFIDEHRRWLIENISTVEPILDRLLSKKVITHENYTHIRSKSTSAQSMRELFGLSSIRSTNKGKDCLYDVLMELEPFVMEELKDAGVK